MTMARARDPELLGHRPGPRRAVRGFTVLAALFYAASFVVPLIEAAGMPGAATLRSVYAPLCHQMPERSIEVGSAHQTVCARCSGLYLGGVVGLFVAGGLPGAVGRRLRPIWLAWAVAPTLVDALLPWIGAAGLANVPRLIVATPAGFVAGLFLAVGVADLSRRIRLPRLTRWLPVMPRSPMEENDG